MAKKRKKRVSRRKEWSPTAGPEEEEEGSAYNVVAFVAPYNDRLPSAHPLQWVESHDRIGDLGVLTFGAYNAFGLIGSEQGGVAVVFEAPERAIIATKAIPYKPQERNDEAIEVIEYIKAEIGERTPVSREALEAFVAFLKSRGYEIR